MNRFRTWKRGGLIFLGAVLIFELTLQLVSVVFFRNPETELSADDKRNVRILAVGESTTDARVSRGRSWPEILQEKLRKRGYRVTVINAGKAGTNSSLILAGLEDELERSRPHVVISMMGINDSGDLRFDFPETPFRTLKLLSLIRERIRQTFACELSRRAPVIEDREILPLFIKGITPNELETLLRSRTDDPEKLSTSFAAFAGRIRLTMPQEKKRILLFLEHALTLDKRNAVASEVYLRALTELREPGCVRIVEEILPCSGSFSDQLLALVSKCIGLSGKTFQLPGLSHRGLSVVTGDHGILRENYTSLYLRLRARSIPLIAVQYPTLPVNSLREFFTDVKDQSLLSFVSNEENFQHALSGHAYSDLFTDRFRVSWGHLTGLGNELIADGVAVEVEKSFAGLHLQGSAL